MKFQDTIEPLKKEGDIMNIYLYNVVKQKTNVLGYWKEGNKIYIDYIEIKKHNKNTIKKAKKDLFLQGEKAVFYKIGNKAYIENQQGKIDILNNRIECKRKKSYKNIETIKTILKQYSGCTVYNKKDSVLIEVYTNWNHQQKKEG